MSKRSKTERVSDEPSDRDQHRRWSASIAKAIESFKRDGSLKVSKSEHALSSPSARQTDNG